MNEYSSREYWASKKFFPLAKGLEGRADRNLLRQIWPLKQALVASIRDYAKTNPMILKIVVFGSATSYLCNINSDLDVGVWYAEKFTMTDVGRVHREMYFDEEVMDVIDVQLLSNSDGLRDEIEKGVTVYEQAV